MDRQRRLGFTKSKGREGIETQSTLIGGFLIAGDVLTQYFEGTRTDLGDPPQLELEEDRINVFLSRADESMHDSTYSPAPGIVLEPQQPLEKAPVLQIIVVAHQPGPAPADRPFCRYIGLLQRASGVAITQVQRFATIWPVSQHQIAALCLIGDRAVLCINIGEPVFCYFAADCRQQVGSRCVTNTGRQGNLLWLEVIALAQHETHLLIARI